MNSITVFSFVLFAAVANAGLIGHGHGVVLQGPSTKTELVGPDGSHIAAHAPGGQVAHSVDVGYVAHTGHVAPVVAHVAPVVAHVAHAAPAVAHSSIVRVDQIHSSPVVAHAAPVVVGHGFAGHGLVGGHGFAAGYGLAGGHGFAAGHGLVGGHGLAGDGHEGEYVHDYSETLYDDGSYKPEVYGHDDDHHDYDHHY